jgi:hypothetical protein
LSFRACDHGLEISPKTEDRLGLGLNVSKSGVSTSIGGHGATLNLSKRYRKTTLAACRGVG